MFYNTRIRSLPLIDTSKGTNFSRMFYGCNLLLSIPELNTGLGTNFVGMFDSCNSLQSIPLLNTSNGTDFSYMFHHILIFFMNVVHYKKQHF